MPDPRHTGGHGGLKKGRLGMKTVNQHNWRAKQDAKAEAAAQKRCLELINDPDYKTMLLKKLQDGTLHPSVHVLLWYYAYGRPRELIETKDVTPVRIEHVYSTTEEG